MLRARVRRLWARLKSREDSEHEQALIRIAVICAMYAFMLLIPHEPQDHAWILWGSTAIFTVGIIGSIAVFAHIAARPAINRTRRFLALLIDTAGANAALFVGGMAASAFYPFLLWTVLGHGFRYGRVHLWTAAVISAVMFGAVVTLNEQWRAIPILSGALVASLVILPAYFAVLLRKLTNAIARAEEASRAKSHFLASMSHELRTPLNAIIGMSEMLGKTTLDAEQRDMTGTVRTAAGTLLTLVDQVLDLAKIEEKRFVIDVEPFDLHESLLRVRMLLGHLATAKGLTLRLHLAPDTPNHLLGGQRQLHQILVNLVGNAIKFTEQGRVALRVYSVARGAAEIRLRIAVEDTGIGLSAEAQASLFERFSRSDDSVRRGISGSGLGLSITRELVLLMGGNVGVTSVLGVGSTFWVELPFALAGPEQAPKRLAGRVVVLGGREPANAVAERIQHFGCETRCVATIESAAELLRRPDLRQALVVTGRVPPVDLAALGKLVQEIVPVEPIDIVAMGLEQRDPTLTLADLTADCSDEVLFSCLRAALHRALTGFAGQSGSDAIVPPRPARSLRILVAEDNRTNQKVIGRILEHAGHRATIVASGQDAVEALEEVTYDLVLMDLNMPVMGGIEAVKLLRFTHDLDELPPIVALTADATSQTQEACHSVGFSAYLTKPIETGRLLRTLDELTAVDIDALQQPDYQPPNVTPPEPERHTERPSAPAVDLRRLSSLAELDQGDGFVAGLIDDFVDDVGAILLQLEDAAARGDTRSFREQAHALRSSAAHVGAMGLFDLCLSWRELDDHALLMRAATELAQLRQEIQRARSDMIAFKSAWLAQDGASAARGGTSGGSWDTAP
jgi:two-component system, sensor histidine kinase RpfC